MQLDKTSNGSGTLVIECLAAEDHLLKGIYEGRGAPSGLDTTVSGLKGKIARNGDVIYLTVYGTAEALIASATTAVAAGDTLAVIDNGAFANSANPAAGLAAPVVALDAAAATTTQLPFTVFVSLL